VLSGREELARYKALQVPAKHSTPLIFWRENTVEFPLLPVARRVLCISASSAQSERDFSSVGRTITDARARLSPSTVEWRLFDGDAALLLLIWILDN